MNTPSLLDARVRRTGLRAALALWHASPRSPGHLALLLGLRASGDRSCPLRTPSCMTCAPALRLNFTVQKRFISSELRGKWDGGDACLRPTRFGTQPNSRGFSLQPQSEKKKHATLVKPLSPSLLLFSGRWNPLSASRRGSALDNGATL
ncbi:hypothetical protein AAFF_G00266050 [Aldrovandia affinis]|uniref:Uncharacterized protein n=1 Tax=Aldrovandia affinis TaxID=143900 RepID=A0AAD7RE48_9TELE|nr:hypothetical protein AAFF_G00266050 [Aldrovandia affinis]